MVVTLVKAYAAMDKEPGCDVTHGHNEMGHGH